MVKIFLESYELDTNEGFSQQITYAIDDLQNLDSKSTAFSKTIVIPGSANNNRLFGNIFEFTNSNFNGDGANVGYNFNAAKSAKVRLEINGLVAIKGILRLLSIVHDARNIEYEVAIFGELGGFINALGNNKLENLDFAFYNHDYTIANIENSWNGTFELIPIYGQFYNTNRLSIIVNDFATFYDNDIITISDTILNNGNFNIQSVLYDSTTQIILGVPVLIKTITFTFVENIVNETISSFTITYDKNGRGYYYPLIDYGLVSSDKSDYQYTAFRPALYVREYLDKIIRNAGYTYESNFLDTDFFTRLIVPNSDNGFFKRGLTEYINADASSQSNSNTTTTIERTNLVFGIQTTLDGFTINPSENIFTYDNPTSISTNIQVHLEGSYSYFNEQSVVFKIYKNNISIYEFEFERPVQNNTFRTIAFVKDFEVVTDFNANDNFTISMEVDALIYYGSTIYFAGFTIDTGSLIVSKYPSGYIEYNLGDTIDIKNTIPTNIFQRDFFTSILKMFYLMVTEDKNREKHLIIEPWVDFYDLSRTSYLDWSDKIDRSQVIKITPMSEINSRFYNLNYKSDNDYFNEDYKKKFNEGYGNVVFDNQLDFAKDSSTTEVIFSATPLVGYEDEDKVVSTIFKWDGTTTDKEEKVSSNIRILQRKLIEGVTSWSIKNGATTLDTFTNYPYAGHLDDPDVPGSDLSFGIPKQLYFSLVSGALGNNLFNTFYSSYLAEITDKDSRLVTAKIKLNEQDIFKLDFGKFIWIDGVLYRLNRIVDYSAGDICTIELLRVIYTTYQTGSPSQTECILTEDSICLQTEDGDNLTIE
jgi:hypothetical protein